MTVKYFGSIKRIIGAGHTRSAELAHSVSIYEPEMWLQLIHACAAELGKRFRAYIRANNKYKCRALQYVSNQHAASCSSYCMHTKC